MADVDESDERPWERKGQVRRDAEPHRGTMLLVFATVSVVCGYLSCCLVVPSFVGLTFAVVVFLFSTRDLGRMRAGLMDPKGFGLTDMANSRSSIGLILNGLVVVYFVAFIIRLLSQL